MVRVVNIIAVLLVGIFLAACLSVREPFGLARSDDYYYRGPDGWMYDRQTHRPAPPFHQDYRLYPPRDAALGRDP